MLGSVLSIVSGTHWTGGLKMHLPWLGGVVCIISLLT